MKWNNPDSETSRYWLFEHLLLCADYWYFYLLDLICSVLFCLSLIVLVSISRSEFQLKCLSIEWNEVRPPDLQSETETTLDILLFLSANRHNMIRQRTDWNIFEKINHLYWLWWTFLNEIIPHFTSFIELLRDLRDQQRNILRLCARPGHHQPRGDKKAGDVTHKIEVNLHWQSLGDRRKHLQFGLRWNILILIYFNFYFRL